MLFPEKVVDTKAVKLRTASVAIADSRVGFRSLFVDASITRATKPGVNCK